jgi:hypothetical protein
VSFAAITLCVASQRVFIVVYFVKTQSGNFWIHLSTCRRNQLVDLRTPLHGVRSCLVGWLVGWLV